MSANDNGCNGAVISPQIHQQVVAIFAEIFQIEIDSQVEDIDRTEIEEWDSVNHLRLVAELEEIFQISLSDEEVTTITSLRDVEKLLIGRGTGSGLRELTCLDQE
jgi:acyl carrier protein